MLVFVIYDVDIIAIQRNEMFVNQLWNYVICSFF